MNAPSTSHATIVRHQAKGQHREDHGEVEGPCESAMRALTALGSIADLAATYHVRPLRADCVEKVWCLARQTPTVE